MCIYYAVNTAVTIGMCIEYASTKYVHQHLQCALTILICIVHSLCALGWPKKLKFCDSEQMMGEVIIKWFYFYYFWFHQPYAPAIPKNQNKKYILHMRIFFHGAQSIRNADETYNIFLAVFWLDQNMENDVNS